MTITKDNLDEILFENQDARLLIQDVVTNTSANLYYYHDVEISVRMAIEIYNRAYQADEEDRFYSVSFLDYSKEKAPSTSMQPAAYTVLKQKTTQSCLAGGFSPCLKINPVI